MMAALLVVLSVPCAASGQQTAGPVVIDDFEAGVKGWVLNDGLATRLGKATLPQVYAVSPGAPESRGKQAALLEFDEGQGTWASISKSVNGGAWADHGCTGIALWLRGDGSRRSVTLVLRSYVKVGETVTDTSYVKEVWLTTPGWLSLHTPFTAFKDREGRPIDESHLRAVKLFQFVKSGSWEPVRFTVDDLRAEAAAPPPKTAPPAEALLLDFDGLTDVSRLQHGVCLGSSWGRLLQDERFAAQLKAALASLGRPTVRLKLSDFYLPGHVGLRTTDFDRMLAWIRSAECEPLLTLDAPLATQGVTPETGWRDFGAFCAGLAGRRRTEPGTHYYEIGNEPLLSGQFRTIEAATEAYNALAAQILLADPQAAVGGMGFASPWDERLEYFVRNARTLRFVSFHFYGAHTAVASDEELFEAACRAEARDLPHQLVPAKVRELLDARSGPRAELWITECALSSAREANGEARDPRVRTHYGAAWVTAFTLAAAQSADRVLWFKAFGNGWGLLNEDGSGTPPLQALALLSRVLPAGAATSAPTHLGMPLFVAPAATPGVRYAILANAAKSARLTLNLSGTPGVEPQRLRRVDPTITTPTFDPLTPSPIQRLTLTGPGMAVLEAPVRK
jgi:hypothetical protein